MLCGSGLKAVILAAQALMSGDASVAIAGGQESMSQVRRHIIISLSIFGMPVKVSVQAMHCAPVRNMKKFGDLTLVDSMLKDGLTDAFGDFHMGITGMS